MTPQERYDQMRAEGLSHNLAEMFALQCPPGMAGTDSAFLEGHCNGSQFDGQEHIGDMYRAEAAAAGVDVKGKVYLGSLAQYPGDPAAWVSGRGDVKRICEERGWGCRGAVNVKAAEPLETPKDIPIASDIVDNQVGEILAHVPVRERPRVDVQDLREQVADRLKPSWSDK